MLPTLICLPPRHCSCSSFPPPPYFAAALGHAQLKHFTAAATAIAIEIECGLPIAA